MAQRPAEIVSAIFDMLEPLSSDERQRIYKSAMTLLGEASVPSKLVSEVTDPTGATEVGDVPIKAKTWLKQNGISAEQLEQVFHVEPDSVEVIATTLPGRSNGEKCRQAYLLTGLSKLLLNGEPKFTDDEAREYCIRAGCYDKNNHGKFIKAMGNEFAGSKSKGWLVTAPGLKAGATFVKDLAGDA